MILTGYCGMSFLLEPIETAGALTFLQPRYGHDEVTGTDYEVDCVAGPGSLWTRDEVTAAAAWWRGVADGREPIDERHVWFGGGVCFGRVSPAQEFDVAVDVIVLDDPIGKRPAIIYNGTQVEVDDPEFKSTYITVDTTAEQVAKAATWWESLALLR